MKTYTNLTCYFLLMTKVKPAIESYFNHGNVSLLISAVRSDIDLGLPFTELSGEAQRLVLELQDKLLLFHADKNSHLKRNWLVTAFGRLQGHLINEIRLNEFEGLNLIDVQKLKTKRRDIDKINILNELQDNTNTGKK